MVEVGDCVVADGTTWMLMTARPFRIGAERWVSPAGVESSLADLVNHADFRWLVYDGVAVVLQPRSPGTAIRLTDVVYDMADRIDRMEAVAEREHPGSVST